jgi:hypothetical protein
MASHIGRVSDVGPDPVASEWSHGTLPFGAAGISPNV